MDDVGFVGRVVGTDDATPLEFWVAVAPGQHIQLDDVVAVDRIMPTGELLKVYGIVGQVRARHEGARFQSDVFLIADGRLPAEVSEAALVQVTRVVPEIFVPPLPGAEVRRAVGDERAAALDHDEVTRRLPAGLSRDGEPVYLDVDFIDGTKGAHVNISGVSGVATKTSYATFLLYALLHSGVLGAETANTKALVFNVKGEDLLFLDHANTRLGEDEPARYAALGLPAQPFRSVAVLAPPRRGDPNATPDVGSRATGVRPFLWTIHQFCAQGLLPFLFADSEDERQQYTIVVQSVTARLRELAGEHDGGDGAVRIEGVTVRRFRDLVEVIERKLIPESPDDPVDQRWTGRAIGPGTINAFVRRLASATARVEHLIRADIADAPRHALDLESHQVTVVDLHALHDRAQRFVVGVVLRQAFERKEASGVAKPLQIVVLDELNKYAPREGSSPIKELLLDVAERGRSLGIILFGAQQTASEVERRVVANSAVRVVGRLDSAEAGRDQYGWLPGAQRQRATILKPGSMYVSQPRLPIPVLVDFPFPAWATRSAEAMPLAAAGGGAGVDDDPFGAVMRLLHTADWHVGKQIRGNSRVVEHQAVLDEIVGVADEHEVDLVVVAGDLFDTAAPAPESQRIVYETLLRLAARGAEVVVIAGNHDNARALAVLGPLFARSGVHVVAEPARPDAGGLHRFTAADGAPVNVALLPFVSKRGIVRAEQLMTTAAFQQAQAYAERMHQLIDALCAPFAADAVNVLVGHAFVHGGVTGGGERAAHLVEEYAVLAPSFPATAGYVALGHLHRAQQLAGATAIHYPGSPLQLDFGESAQVKQVNVVELEPGLPARVIPVELRAGRALRSYTGTVEQLAATVADDDAWLRLVVREAHRAGLGQEVRERFGDRVVDVRIESPMSPSGGTVPTRRGRSPYELFAEYMASRGVDDRRVAALFAELLDDLSSEPAR